MSHFCDLLDACEEDISWRDLFSKAVESLRPEIDWQHQDFDLVNAAQAGMSMLMEVLCDDPAAKGRTSKKAHAFLSMIRAVK